MSSQNRATLRLVPSLDAAAVPAPREPVDDPPPIEPLGDGAAPGATECLPCYVDRLVAREGCDGTQRWTLRWRDVRAPRAAKLRQRLADRGGFCDCEVLLNVYRWHFAVLDDEEEVDRAATDGDRPCSGRSGGRATDPCRPPARPWWA